MRLIVVVILSLVINSRTLGQFRFQNDKSFNYHGDSLLLKAGIKQSDFKKIDFELRFWIKDLSGVNANELFILQHSGQNLWYLRHYTICVINNKYTILNKSDSTLVDWKNQWGSLVNNGILDLPDESKVRKKWRSSKGLTTIFGDGALYIFELSAKKTRRKYVYSNPESNLKNYDLNNAELININNIIDILENRFRFKENFQPCPHPGAGVSGG